MSPKKPLRPFYLFYVIYSDICILVLIKKETRQLRSEFTLGKMVEQKLKNVKIEYTVNVLKVTNIRDDLIQTKQG